MMEFVLAVLVCGVLDRMRGGASYVVAEKTGAPLDAVRWASFLGFGTVLALVALRDVPAPMDSVFLISVLFGLGMWLGSKFGGWSGLFGAALRLPSAGEERWQVVEPLRNVTFGIIVRMLVWGLPGLVLGGLGAWFLTPESFEAIVRELVTILVALAIAGVAAPALARKIVPVHRWFTGEEFFFSTWGVMEFLRGALAGALVWLA